MTGRIAYFLLGAVTILVTGARSSREENDLPGEIRYRRGLLSRTGVCPAANTNFQMKDQRLNFYGQAYYLPPDPATMGHECEEAECYTDHQCHADRRCCQNVCGAKVCTTSVRDPHPCSMFTCPQNKVCKLQRVRCILPNCPDMYALPRPVCVHDNTNMKRERIFNSMAGDPFAYIFPVKPFYQPEVVKRNELAARQKISWPYNSAYNRF